MLVSGTSTEIDGVKIFGLGGEIPKRSDAAWNTTMKESVAAELLEHAAGHDILVTHTPPLNFCDL